MPKRLGPARFWGELESNGGVGAAPRRRGSHLREEIGCFPRGNGSIIAHGWDKMEIPAQRPASSGWATRRKDGAPTFIVYGTECKRVGYPANRRQLWATSRQIKKCTREPPTCHIMRYVDSNHGSIGLNKSHSLFRPQARFSGEVANTKKESL